MTADTSSLRSDRPHLAAALRQHAEHLVDAVLQAPWTTFVPAPDLASRLLQASRAACQQPAWFELLRATLGRWRAQALACEQPSSQLVPASAVAPLLQAFAAPIVPQPALSKALVDHPAARELMQHVLVETLFDFAKRLRDFAPEPPKVPGLGLASRLVGAASSVASGVASRIAPEIERHLDRHVRTFAQEALDKATQTLLARLCDRDFAKSLVQWRQDGLKRVMDLPVANLARQIEGWSDDELARWIQSTCAALLNDEGWQGWIENELVTALQEYGPVSIGEWAAGLGIERQWLIDDAERGLRWMTTHPELIKSWREVDAALQEK